MRHQKQVILQVILINTFTSLTSSHRWTFPAPLQSAREWAWGEAPFPKHPSRPPSQQFAEVVVGSSVQQVQEDSDDEEGQDEQQQVEGVPSQQQGQQDKVKWCCKHCQRVLSGKNGFNHTPYHTPYCNSPAENGIFSVTVVQKNDYGP